MSATDAGRQEKDRTRSNRRSPKKRGSVVWLWALLGCGGTSALACVVLGGIAAIFLSGSSGAPAVEPNPRIKQMPGLIAYWSFDQAANGRVLDHSGRDHHLKLLGGRFDHGIRGKALVLDGGVDQYGEIPAHPDFNFAVGAPFTIAGWCRTPLQSATVLSLTASQGPSQIDYLVRDNRFIVVVGDDDDRNQQNAFVWSKMHNDGAWHHFVIIRRGNAVQLWIDGVLQGEMGALKSGGPITTNQRALGSERGWVINNDQRWGNPGFQGGIDEVCVFSRAIEHAEIQVLLQR